MKKFIFNENDLQGAQEVILELDKKTVTLKNIDKIIAEQNLNFDVNVVYVRWKTERKVSRAFGTKTVYKDNLFAFKKDCNNEWGKRDLSSTRTI